MTVFRLLLFRSIEVIRAARLIGAAKDVWPEKLLVEHSTGIVGRVDNGWYDLLESLDQRCFVVLAQVNRWQDWCKAGSASKEADVL